MRVSPVTKPETKTQAPTTDPGAGWRDAHGRLTPGHPNLFFEHKPGDNAIRPVGRPIELKHQIRDILEQVRDALPSVLQSMADRATGREQCPAAVRQQASEYLTDRVLGKSTQPIAGLIAQVIIVRRERPDGQQRVTVEAKSRELPAEPEAAHDAG